MIKYRIFDKQYNEYCEEPDFRWTISREGKLYNSENDKWHNVGERFIIQFFTGLRDVKGNDIYNGDVLFCNHRKHWFKVFSVPGGFAVNTHQDDFKRDKIIFYTGLSDMQNSGWIQSLEIKNGIYNPNC